MFISEVPLVTFYSNLLPAARKAGYKMALTALAREADAPAFYDDLKRYWASLYDATGPDIIFVFAGPNAAMEFSECGLRHRREPIAFRSDQIAFEGFQKKKWNMHWEGQSKDRQHIPDLQKHQEHPGIESAGRYRTHIEENEPLSRDQTLEIYSLSRYLGIRESELPCLVLTLLQPGRDSEFEQIPIPFEHFSNTSLYQYVKRLAESCEDFFKVANQLRLDIEKAQLNLADAKRKLNKTKDPLWRAENSRMSVRYHAKDLPEEAAAAVAKILDLTKSSNNTSQNRSESWREFQTVKAAHPRNWGVIPELQRLIDLSLSYESERADLIRAEKAKKVNELECEVSQLESKQAKYWSEMELQLLDLVYRKKHDDESTEKWDFFIAYSSTDRPIAERVFSEVSRVGKTFLDSRCLRPGDRWTERIRTVQNAAKCTIFVISKSTPNGWFAESEYLYAIQLARSSNHVLIPILYGECAELPYGLEQIHAARVDKWTDFTKLPQLVEHIARSVDDLETKHL